MKSGSIDPDNDFAIKYEIIEKAEKYVKELAKEVQEDGWVQGRSGRVRKISPPTGIRSPGPSSP